MPAVRPRQGLADEAGSAPLRRLQARYLRERGHDIPGQQAPVARLVQGGLGDHESEIRDERIEFAAAARAWELPDRLELPSEVSGGDDAVRAGTPDRIGRS